MDWSSELRALREEMDSRRTEPESEDIIDEAEREARLAQLKDLFQSLQIEESLSEMNRVLLDNQGVLEVYAPWELEEDVEEEEDDVLEEDFEEDEELYEESDAASAVLSWGKGTRVLAVDIEMGQKGFYLEVNDTDVSLDQNAVKQALIQAFREEMGL